MTTSLKTAALALAAGLFTALPFAASAQTAPKTVDPAVVDAYIKSTFGHSSPEWLARIESAAQANPRDPTLQYLAGMACLHRGLWGRAQMLLAQAARSLQDDGLRRHAWRALAQLAALPDHALVIDGNCVEIMPEDVAVAETGFTVASGAYPQTMQAAPGV